MRRNVCNFFNWVPLSYRNSIDLTRSNHVGHKKLPHMFRVGLCFYLLCVLIVHYFKEVNISYFQKPIGGIAVLPTGSFNFMRRKKDKDVSKVSK